MKKVIVSILIVLILVLNPIAVYADSVPGTISVSGGSVGSGGIEGNSNVLKGTALAVVMATLASVGITVKLTAEDYARGYNAINFVQDKFEEWEANANRGWDAYQALNTTKVGANGELYVNQNASGIIQQFLNWLTSENYISPDVGTGGGGVDGTFYGNTWVSPSGYSYVIDSGLEANISAIQIQGQNKYRIFAFSTQPFTIRRILGQDVRRSNANKYNDWYYAMNGYFEESSITGLFNISTLGYYYTGNAAPVMNYLNSLNSTEQPDTNIAQTGFYGETADIPQLVDESGNGKILTVQPGLIGQVQDAYTGSNDTTIGIQDYLDALRDLYGQQALPQDITDLPDISINGEDVNTGTKEEVAVIDRDIPIYPGITIPSDPDSITWPDVPDITSPIADPIIIASPEVAIPAMSFDLRDYFPFCIPFDIYNLLSKLNAEPVTPVIVIDWGDILGSIGVNYEMTIDLSEYNNIAAILRTMELFAFIIGLGVATRSMYIRG